jgi:hypothetical protein
MIILHGKVLDIVPASTNRTTGQIIPPAVEVLHKVRGKSEVQTLKIDASTEPSWAKVIGQNITVEVNFYAMATKEGGVLAGFTLTDKKALPTLQAAPRPVAAAA